MGKYIIYQGHAELFRWREVDEKGNTVIVDGKPSQSELLPTREAAIKAAEARDPKAELDIRPTIQEVAEGSN